MAMRKARKAASTGTAIVLASPTIHHKPRIRRSPIIIEPTPIARPRDPNAGVAAFGAFVGGVLSAVLMPSAPAPAPPRPLASRSSLMESEIERMAMAIHSSAYASGAWAMLIEPARELYRRMARAARAEMQCGHCGRAPL